MQSINSPKLIKALPLLIILIGVLARINVFVHNRSFFIDEANLARNIVEKPISGYFDSLDYEQYAPPLLLLETKLVTQILGVRDYAFRLIPFLSGLGCILLLWFLLKEWVEEDLAMIYGLSLFCFSVLAIRYGTEFKQYSTDAFLTLLLIGLAWKDREESWETTKVLWWAGVGMVSIWYSMPIVFILAGAGLFFMLQANASKDRAKVVAVGFSWLLSFGLYYYFILSKDVYDSNLQNHHDEFFFKLFSSSGETWSNNVKLIVGLFKEIADKTAVPVAFAMLSFLIGLYQLVKSGRHKWALLGLPIILLLLVSSFRMYSLIPRMTLFILPLFILIISMGLGLMWRKCNTPIRLILAALVILSTVNKKGYTYLMGDMEIENVKSAMTVLQENIKPGQKIFVHHEATPAFAYYNELSAKPFHITDAYLSDWRQSPKKFYLENQQQACFWILFSHTLQDEVLHTMNTLDEFGNAELFFGDKASSVYQFCRK